ncbi:hypothetical protein K438DRAFT_2067464 [Mycena galopus ATCC 62051]|nr:hypothetical protein K438DRAFT_2067464 [Mycena galopus ATCC 62051]
MCLKAKLVQPPATSSRMPDKPPGGSWWLCASSLMILDLGGLRDLASASFTHTIFRSCGRSIFEPQPTFNWRPDLLGFSLTKIWCGFPSLRFKSMHFIDSVLVSPSELVYRPDSTRVIRIYVSPSNFFTLQFPRLDSNPPNEVNLDGQTTNYQGQVLPFFLKPKRHSSQHFIQSLVLDLTGFCPTGPKIKGAHPHYILFCELLLGPYTFGILPVGNDVIQTSSLSDHNLPAALSVPPPVSKIEDTALSALPTYQTAVSLNAEFSAKAWVNGHTAGDADAAEFFPHLTDTICGTGSDPYTTEGKVSGFARDSVESISETDPGVEDRGFEYFQQPLKCSASMMSQEFPVLSAPQPSPSPSHTEPDDPIAGDKIGYIPPRDMNLNLDERNILPGN